MSRVGKQQITLPDKTTHTFEARRLTITGPLGTVSRLVPTQLDFKFADGVISVTPKGTTPSDRALWGTYGAHLKNMVTGVTTGFKKVLLLEGVGYRVAEAGGTLKFSLGFSHPVELAIPPGLKVTVDKNQITIEGVDREVVGQFAAVIREHKPVEPYKGKGIRYNDEFVRRKAGKKVTA